MPLALSTMIMSRSSTLGNKSSNTTRSFCSIHEPRDSTDAVDRVEEDPSEFEPPRKSDMGSPVLSFLILNHCVSSSYLTCVRQAWDEDVSLMPTRIFVLPSNYIYVEVHSHPSDRQEPPEGFTFGFGVGDELCSDTEDDEREGTGT